jgi:hypothetical protein
VFRFDGPLTEAIERQKGQRFMEAKSMVSEAMQLDPACASMINWRDALRDAMAGKRIPAKWTRSEAEVEQYARELTAKQEAQQQLAMVQQGADAAKTAGEAEAALAAA